MWPYVGALVYGLATPIIVDLRPDARLGPGPPDTRTLRIYFIKPSRYDDDGYVLRFRWGVIPNNTLAVLDGLTDAYTRRQRGVHIQTVLWDEMVDGIVSPAVIQSIRERGRTDGTEVIVGIAGVQTNQYPRARDIALQFMRLGLPILMGGFHVSSHAPSRDFLMSAGITVVVGEAENTWPKMLDDYLRSGFGAIYRNAGGIRARTATGSIEVPNIDRAPLPAIDARYLKRFFDPSFATIDTSRGCPFACVYCSVKNVMGRTVRSRDPIAVVEWIRDAYDRCGIRSLLVVDDDLFRSPAWEKVLLGTARLRRDGREDLGLVIQTDVEAPACLPPAAGETGRALHRLSRRFVDLAAAAGCFEVFMGFESLNPANLEYAVKHPNRDSADRRTRAAVPRDATLRLKSRYERAVDRWHSAGVGVHCGYIIGLPFDGHGCGRQAAKDLAEIGVDIASFFAYTPFPGTEEYDRGAGDGTLLTDDFNEYDSVHCVRRHPVLTREEIHREYEDAYRYFYTWTRLAWSLATRHRVPGLSRTSRDGMRAQQVYFTYATRRGRHPMMGGIWRLRKRVCRREAIGDREAARLYLAPMPVTQAAGRMIPPFDRLRASGEAP